MLNRQISGQILKDDLVKVKKEVYKIASLAEVDGVDAAARYIGNYINNQSYRVKKYGDYPDQMYPGILAKLARMSESERDEFITKLMKMEGL